MNMAKGKNKTKKTIKERKKSGGKKMSENRRNQSGKNKQRMSVVTEGWGGSGVEQQVVRINPHTHTHMHEHTHSGPGKNAAVPN